VPQFKGQCVFLPNMEKIICTQMDPPTSSCSALHLDSDDVGESNWGGLVAEPSVHLPILEHGVVLISKTPLSM
jgi:hypothetical protein